MKKNFVTTILVSLCLSLILFGCGGDGASNIGSISNTNPINTVIPVTNTPVTVSTPISVIQTPTQLNTGKIQGMVKDNNGKPIIGAEITIDENKIIIMKSYTNSTFTDNDGKYQFNNVPQGNYALTVKVNNQSLANTSVLVNSGNTATVNVENNNQVTVTYPTPLPPVTTPTTCSTPPPLPPATHQPVSTITPSNYTPVPTAHTLTTGGSQHGGGIDVPYINQFYSVTPIATAYDGTDKRFYACGPTSCTMLLVKYGLVNNDITSISNEINTIYGKVFVNGSGTDPVKLRDYINGNSAYNSRIEAVYEYVGGLDYTSLDDPNSKFGKIRTEIDNGRPVIVGILDWNHVIVVIGYYIKDGIRYLIINDPGGDRYVDEWYSFNENTQNGKAVHYKYDDFFDHWFLYIRPKQQQPPPQPPTGDIGKNSRATQLFIDAYNRYGSANLGTPKNTVHRWGNGEVQNFTGGNAGDSVIMLKDGANYAYVIIGGIWAKYASIQGPDSPLGYPISDEGEATQSSYGTKGKYNKFENGVINYIYKCPSNQSLQGQAFVISGNIYSKYMSMGYSGSVLGFPVSDQGDTYPSSVSNITGKYNKFEAGTIITYNSGTYEVHGDIFKKYTELNYSKSKLGQPTSSEYSWNGGARSDFEGGYIFCKNGQVTVY